MYSLEYYVSLGCTNSCVGCSHGAPIRKGLIDVKVFETDVLKMAQVTLIQRFALSGGEPLLHPQIEELMEIARFSGLSKEVMVLTNGVLLDKQPESFWEKLDVLRISRYPNQLKDEQIKRWKNHAHQYGAEFMCLDIDKFYKPLTRHVNSPEEIKKRFSKCPYFNKCAAIHNGMYYPCSQASFFPELFSFKPNRDDCFPIDHFFKERLNYFMLQTFPPASCSRCTYDLEIPWQQTTKENWVKDSTV